MAIPMWVARRHSRLLVRSPATALAVRVGLRLLLIGLIAGCTPAASLAPSSTTGPASNPPLPTASAPTATPTLPPATPEPSLTAVGSLRTPTAASATATLSGIKWTKIGQDNELARLNSMTSWSGGLVAWGDLVASEGTARTPVWTSTDGASWTALSPAVFGHAAAVLGISATRVGLVALTAQASAGPCEGDPQTSCIVFSAPVDAWTSVDGASWVAHAASELDAFSPIEPIALRTGPTGVLAFQRAYNGRGLAISTDGVTWETVPASALPAGFEIWNVDSFGGEWLATGIVWTDRNGDPFGQPTVVTSTDARSWQVRTVPTAGFPESFGVDQIGSDVQRVYAARDGLIVTGSVQGAPSPETWWSSVDGQAWRAEPDYRPVGVWISDSMGSGITADGDLVANGRTMIAFRVEHDAAAWSSTDGRHWTHITMHGNPYEGPESADGRLLFTPVGIVWEQINGTAWLGELLSE
jgi:hypothetical protein